MKQFKYIALIILFLLLTTCKESNEINPLILGEWCLFGIKKKKK